MNNTEIDILRVLGGRADVRLFRNHVAQGWTGETVRNEGGAVLLRNARRAAFGLAPGSGDFVGWQSLLITPAMVGQTVGRFISLEAKGGTGRSNAQQDNWARRVNEGGGVAGVVRSADQALYLLGLARS